MITKTLTVLIWVSPNSRVKTISGLEAKHNVRRSVLTALDKE